MAKVKSPLELQLAAWHLKRVPFPSTPFVEYFNENPLRNGLVFDADLRKPEIDQIRHEILKHGYTSELRPWSWMWARTSKGRNAGLGKTALLAYVADQVNQDYGASFFGWPANWLVIYVPLQPKTRSMAEVAVRTLASASNGAHGLSVERLLLSRLRRRLILLDGSHPARLRSAPETKFADDKWLRDNGVDLNDLTEKVRQDLCEHEVTEGLATALAGGTLAGYLYKMNGDQSVFPPRPRLTKVANTLLFDDFAKAVHAANVVHVTVLLDDIYFLLRRTSYDHKAEVAADIRDIAVDGSYFAVTHDLFNWVAVMHTQTAPTFRRAWEDRGMEIVASLNHLAHTGVELRPLPLSEGPALLTAYLEYNRPSHAPSPIFPFNEEALAAITRIAAEDDQGTIATACEPRSLLQVAFDVMWAALSLALENQYVPIPITAEFVDHVTHGTPMALADGEDEEPDTEVAVGSEKECPCSCHSDDEAEHIYDLVARVSAGGETVLGYFCTKCNVPITI